MPTWFVNLMEWSRKRYESLDRSYEDSLRWVLDHRRIFIIAVLLIFVGSLTLVPMIGTEFLPVSSTAHLTLAEHLMFGGRPMPLAFDVLLHGGTLIALMIYFRRELLQVAMGCLGRDSEGRKLALWLFIAMIPTGIFGLATKGVKEAAKEHLWVYGIGLVCTSGLLFLANRLSCERNNLRHEDQAGRGIGDLRASDALAVGAIQGIGGGFGLSRSGSTIAMGVFQGLRLPASARFSFLLGVPTIAPLPVRLVSPIRRAMPKSLSTGRSRLGSRTLAGLMSRCTMPLPCA